MALEDVNYVTELVKENPPGTDAISEGDNHIRLIKKVLTQSLPDVDRVASTIITMASPGPTTNVKGTIWYDTSANTLKINTATTGATASWVEIGTAAPWVTSPASACMFRATMGATQSVSINTTTLVSFNTESFDIGGDYDHSGSDYDFEAPATGYYFLHASTRWSGPSSSAHGVDDDMYIRKNGATYAQVTAYEQYFDPGAAYVQAYPVHQVTCVMNMTAGDKATVHVRSESEAVEIHSGNDSFFEGYRLA